MNSMKLAILMGLISGWILNGEIASGASFQALTGCNGQTDSALFQDIESRLLARKKMMTEFSTNLASAGSLGSPASGTPAGGTSQKTAFCTAAKADLNQVYVMDISLNQDLETASEILDKLNYGDKSCKKMITQIGFSDSRISREDYLNSGKLKAACP